VSAPLVQAKQALPPSTCPPICHSHARHVMPRHRLHPESELSVSALDSDRLFQRFTKRPMQLISFPLLREQQYA